MAENKTKPTGASVEDYIASRANAQQRTDCRELMVLFKKITRHSPKMWGPSIVGHGSYRYTYGSDEPGNPLWQPLPSVAENWWSTWWLKRATTILAVQAGQAQDDQVLPVLQAACGS